MSKRYGKAYGDRSYRTQRQAVLEAAGYRCEVRGPHCTGVATTVDHIVALAEGGTHDPSNLRGACAQCNFAAGTMIANRRRAERSLGRRSRRW